jgi:cytochrome c nitrite reductase small subunit
MSEKDSQAKRHWWHRSGWRDWVIAGFVLLFAGWFVIWGPIGLAELPASPEFCASCHNMQPEYQSWHVSKHNAQICADCHLPAEPVSRLFWDSILGIRDVWEFAVVGKWPEPIRALPRTQEFLQQNCIRCHGAKVHAAVSSERYCWQCHRELYHRQQLWKDEQTLRRSYDPRN